MNEEGEPAPRALFWLEFTLAVVCAGLAVVTIFWHGWIETLTGFDPDHHNGSFEWLIVAMLFTGSGLAGLAARGEWRRAVRDPYEGYVDL